MLGYVTMVSPYNVNTNNANEFHLNSSGTVNNNNVNNTNGVRPVVSLSADVEMIGSGKWNDPYRLPPPTFAQTILANNGGKEYIETKSHAFNTTSTTNDGMYATEDDYGTSYYFRGAIDNNWVKFGKNSSNLDIWWRIVRINGDGSVKLIYTGTTAPTEAQKVVMTGAGTQTETSAFNTSYNSGEYLGYMYTLNEHRGHSTSSTIKTKLDTWYANNLLDYEEYLSDFVVCNDRGFTTDNWTPIGLPSSNMYSDVYRRLRTNNTPQLICPHKEDRYTVKDTIIGNGQLSYPVGLLTADEATLAGGYRTTANSSYYLYTNQYYWLVSPCYVNAANYAREFLLGSSGAVGNYLVNDPNGVRPVVSLSSELSVSGSGHWNDPYIVE